MALFVILDEMPFDRWNGEVGFIHATGFAIVEADGSLTMTYEDEDHAEPGDDDIVIDMDQYVRYRRDWI